MSVVAQLASTATRAELITEGQSRGLLVTPVNEVTDVAQDAHLIARDFFVDVEQPDGQRIRLAGSSFRSDIGRCHRGPAPALGAVDAVLAQLTRRTPTAVNDAIGSGLDQRQPLAGIRVVDFTWAIAGSFTTRLLADLGADVIKLESEYRPDPIRHIGTKPTDTVSLDTSGTFQDSGAGKRAVTLNLDTEEGRDLARRLIATADVVAANYTPDRLDRWGFDRETVATLRPGLIVANLAVMGLSGPRRRMALVRQRHRGHEWSRRPHRLRGSPSRRASGRMHTDFTVPYLAAMQILAALHHRDRSGQGAYLELSQYESSVRLMDLELAMVLNGGDSPGRNANRSPWCDPHGIFPTRQDDRWVAIACRDNAERFRLGAVIGTEPTDDTVGAWTCMVDQHDIVHALRAAAVPVSAVEDLGDHHTDPHTRALWRLFELPAGVTAMAMQAPLVWDGQRLPLRRAPVWMEHTYDVIVTELGVEPERFAELLEQRVLW